MNHLRQLEDAGQGLADGPVDPVSALRAPGDVDEGQRWVQSEPRDGRVARAQAQLGAERVAGEDDLVARKPADRRLPAHGDAPRQARRQAVGEAGHAGLLVDDHGDARARRGRHHRKGHEPTGAQHHTRAEPAEEPAGLDEPGGDVDGEIAHVLPVPVAPQLARRDGVIRDRRVAGLVPPRFRAHFRSRCTGSPRSRSTSATASPGLVWPPVPPPAMTTGPAITTGADPAPFSRWRSRARSRRRSTRAS